MPCAAANASGRDDGSADAAPRALVRGGGTHTYRRKYVARGGRSATRPRRRSHLRPWSRSGPSTIGHASVQRLTLRRAAPMTGSAAADDLPIGASAPERTRTARSARVTQVGQRRLLLDTVLLGAVGAAAAILFNALLRLS